MTKKFILLLILSNLLSPLASSSNMSNQKNIQELLNQVRNSSQLHQSNLPSPYSFLLSQPLLTKALERYYERKAFIKKIYVSRNVANNTYFRTIIMLIDSNKKRNDFKIAQKNNETSIVELAFITINLAELPKPMINDILYSDIPFGTLLTKYHIEIKTSQRSYLSTRCDNQLAELIHCHLEETLYGRTNTILSKVNKEWLAEVVELLA